MYTHKEIRTLSIVTMTLVHKIDICKILVKNILKQEEKNNQIYKENHPAI